MNLSMKEFLAFPGKDGEPAVKGIAIGNCVRGDSWDDRHDARELGSGHREHAHAHYCDDDDEVRGWICIRYPEGLGRKHRVSGTLMHELAHLISGHGHDDAWRRAMARLGQFVGPAWQKRPRKSPA